MGVRSRSCVDFSLTQRFLAQNGLPRTSRFPNPVDGLRFVGLCLIQTPWVMVMVPLEIFTVVSIPGSMAIADNPN